MFIIMRKKLTKETLYHGGVKASKKDTINESFSSIYFVMCF